MPLQLLSTRIALYKLRQYLKKVAHAVPDLLDRDSRPVDFHDILLKSQHDVVIMERVGEVSDRVEPLVPRPALHSCCADELQVCLFRAICRSLAGGRVDLTEHLFQRRWGHVPFQWV